MPRIHAQDVPRSRASRPRTTQDAPKMRPDPPEPFLGSVLDPFSYRIRTRLVDFEPFRGRFDLHCGDVLRLSIAFIYRNINDGAREGSGNSSEPNASKHLDSAHPWSPKARPTTVPAGRILQTSALNTGASTLPKYDYSLTPLPFLMAPAPPKAAPQGC